LTCVIISRDLLACDVKSELETVQECPATAGTSSDGVFSSRVTLVKNNPTKSSVFSSATVVTCHGTLIFSPRLWGLARRS